MKPFLKPYKHFKKLEDNSKGLRSKTEHNCVPHMTRDRKPRCPGVCVCLFVIHYACNWNEMFMLLTCWFICVMWATTDVLISIVLLFFFLIFIQASYSFFITNLYCFFCVRWFSSSIIECFSTVFFKEWFGFFIQFCLTFDYVVLFVQFAVFLVCTIFFIKSCPFEVSVRNFLV